MSPRLAALAAIAALAACGPPPGTQTPACQKDSDCPQGFFCNGKQSCQVSLGCTSDAQCTAPLRCNVETGECLCSQDSDCAAGQLCNTTGHCQSPTDCFYNTDCASGFICDTKSHGCIPAHSCLQDVQCPLGQVCHPNSDGGGACQPGCIQDGDCPLATIEGPGQVQYVPQACLNGQCTVGACNFTSTCPFGDSCQNNYCESACSPQTPYCQTCDPNQPNSCGGGANFCVIDSRDDPSCGSPLPPSNCLHYCSIDCDKTPCPAGYDCSAVVLLNPTASSGQPDSSCQCGSNCNDGTPCQCSEGDTNGLCPCHADSDCPQDSCVGAGLGAGICGATGASCQSDSDCPQDSCQQGACVIAHTCGVQKQFECPAGGGACEGG